MHNNLVFRRIFVFCLGVIFGMASWDLMFETQVSGDLDALAATYSFYRVLMTSGSPIMLILLVSMLYGFLYLIINVWINKNRKSYVSLFLFTAMFAVEMGIAVTSEAMFIKMGHPSGFSSSQILEAQSYVDNAKHVHFSMLVILIVIMLMSGGDDQKKEI